ncbi:hypothetical protein D3C76_1205950 [compost metagenome]
MLRRINLSETHRRQVELPFLRETHQMPQAQFTTQGIDRNGVSHLPRFETRLLQRRRLGAGLAHEFDAPGRALDIGARWQRHFQHPVTQRSGGLAGDDHLIEIEVVAGQWRVADRFKFEGESRIPRHQSRQATGDGHGHRIDRRLLAAVTQCSA